MINNVKVVRKGTSLEFHVPTDMTGAKFESWKKRNSDAIDSFKDDSTEPTKDEPG